MYYVVNILWIYPYTILIKQDRNMTRANIKNVLNIIKLSYSVSSAEKNMKVRFLK